STKTLYRLIPTKAELFTDVVTERCGRFVLEIDEDAAESSDPAAILERMLVAYATLTLEARTIEINRLVLGECGNFPEIGATFYQNAILRTNEAMENSLRRLSAPGPIPLNDPLQAT